ncbi:MAG: UbiA family prenyltransferase, partial [Micromonosporaceae bacterium]
MAAFVRLSVLGVTVIMPFLAAASSSVPLSLAGRPIVALLVVGVAFHVFAYVSNDVIDLPIDRTAPARASSPLVRGTVRPAQGAAVAAAQVPIGVAATWWGGGHARGVGALLVACALMLAYNLWGKRSPWPL